MSPHESDQSRAQVVRTEQADLTVPVEGKDSAFAPDSPEAIPKLHVPGLSPDATSVPPEALRGEVPTLTEAFVPEAAAQPQTTHATAHAQHAHAEAETSSIHTVDEVDVDEEALQVVPELVQDSAVALVEVAPEDDIDVMPQEPMQESMQEPGFDDEPAQQTQAQAQEPAPQADTWAVQMQVRIGKLNDEIGLLNDRLDRFEKLPKV